MNEFLGKLIYDENQNDKLVASGAFVTSNVMGNRMITFIKCGK